MKFLKSSFLLGALAATTLGAQAQSSRTYTSVDANGNVTRTTVQTPLADAPNTAALMAKQGVLGGDSTASSARIYRGRGDSRNYYYPVPYPVPATNNYYYPAAPTTTELGTRPYPWVPPTTITNIPLGNTYNSYPTNGYPAPACPAPAYGYPAPGYPTYGYPAPGYPYPAYGYPAPSYGYPAYSYPTPGYGYPTYNGTFYSGTGTGSIHSESENGGYGFSVGSGGISIHLGNHRSTSSTTVTRY